MDVTTLADALAPVLRELVDATVAPLVARLEAAEKPRPQPDIDALVAAECDRRMEAMIDELKRLAESICSTYMAAQPKAIDGTSVTIEDVRPLVDELVAAKVAEIPAAKDGNDADPEVMRAMVAEQVAALPAAKDGDPGKDASPEAIAAEVAKVLSTWERPKDGASVTVDDVMPALQERLDRAVAAIPAAKDGVGLAGLLVDSDGDLVGTLSDGSIHKLGPARGERGLDGFGFEDMTFAEDVRTFTLRFTKGDQVKEFTGTKPTLADLHQGIWTEGEYKRGDVVTWGGSQWLALADTDARPETTKDWVLVVKRGRDGKAPLERPANTSVKLK